MTTPANPSRPSPVDPSCAPPVNPSRAPPVNPSRPPPLYWGEVTIIAEGDERQGLVGEIVVRHQQKTSDGQWVYDVRFPGNVNLVRYTHNQLYIGRV
ncbi:hypothetical protein FRB95_008896 [Tulasnella sp. JGI-2019a]|nr:hypothetical protein FRB95_008896 [Tulasnella sp. JGI-2019a]